jgi:hypothetical protein
VLADDVLRELRALLGRGPGAQGLLDRDDVVVDGLGQPDHGQRVVMAGQEARQVSGGGIRVVAADGVQHIHPVGRQPVGGRLQRVDTLGDQTPLDQVGGIGQLDPRVADGRAAERVQPARILPYLRRHGERIALQQTLVAVSVGDDLDFGGQLGVALDQTPDR